MGESPKRHTRRLVLLTWVLVVVFYFYLSYDYIRVTSTDKKLGEYIEYVVELAGTEHRPAMEIRALILVKADELGLPIKGEQIVIAGSGSSLNVSLDYDVEIEFPGLNRMLYSKNFKHNVKYHQFR